MQTLPKFPHIRLLIAAAMALLCPVMAAAQYNATVQNRPYADLRPLHFGVVVGTHLQDMELTGVGTVVTTDEEGNTTETLVMADQDRWEPGFNVGVMAELRLHELFQLRLVPAMYFGNRHIQFRNITDPDNIKEEKQDLKTAYITSAVDIVFASPRKGNHRPFLFTGLTPAINLSGNSDDILKLKRYCLFFEIGVGCDFYLPFFKLRPELKFMYSLGNSLDTDHADQMRDRNLQSYAKSIEKVSTKMITLSFSFE